MPPIHAAHAPYLMFLDADDLLPPNACQTLYDGLLKTDADLVTGYCRYVDENGGVLQEISPAYAELHPRITHLPEELSDELLMRDSFWCRLYKSNIVSENGLFSPLECREKTFSFCTVIFYVAAAPHISPSMFMITIAVTLPLRITVPPAIISGWGIVTEKYRLCLKRQDNLRCFLSSLTIFLSFIYVA